MKLSNYLGDKPFWRVTLTLALPIALQNVLTSSFQLVDTLMVSQLGDVTLSAVGMAGQWGWLAMLLGFGLCSGMSVFVSQYWGVRDIKGIRRVLGMALILVFLLSGAFMTIALTAPEFIISLFNKDPEVIAIGSRYLRIICLSYPATILTNVLATVLRNTEQVKAPLYVSMVTTVANAVMNYGLIFGKLGMPQLGVAGAAIASCISAWMGPLLLVLISCIQKNLLLGPVKELVAFHPRDLLAFIKRALPVLINEGGWSLGIVCLNMIYSNIGYEYYAGITVYKTFADLCFAFYAGLGNACVIMVGKSVGQGKISRALQDANRFSCLLPLAGLLIGGLMIIFRHPLVSVFAMGDNLSQLTIQTALAVTVFCGLEVAFRNITYVQVVGVFRSGGDTITGMFCDLLPLWLVAIPATWAAANLLHLPFIAVVATAYLAEDIPKVILCVRHFKSRKWLKPVTKEGKAGLESYKNQTGGNTV